MVRIVATGGNTEYAQLRNVDTFANGKTEVLHAKGTMKAQTAIQRVNGIGAGKIGAIYRAGGYQVRVSFTENAGDLEEMDVDTSGLYSVFLREFTGDVLASDPSRVYAKLHGRSNFLAQEAYLSVPVFEDGLNYCDSVNQVGCTLAAASTILGQTSATRDGAGRSDVGLGDTTSFKGDESNLKVMAGMSVKIGDQVRLVVTDITNGYKSMKTHEAAGGVLQVTKVMLSDTPYFTVDQPFVRNSLSETVDDVDYIFYQNPVEQLYDEAAYTKLTISAAVYLGALMVTSTTAATLDTVTPLLMTITNTDDGWLHSGKCDFSGTIALGGNPRVCVEDTVNTGDKVFALGNQMTCVWDSASGTDDFQFANPTLSNTYVIGTRTGTDTTVLGLGIVDLQSKNGNDGAISTAASAPYTGNGACRMYNSMTTLSSATVTSATLPSVVADAKGPPLHKNHRTRWATVTDQRPLTWNSPDIDYQRKSRVIGSPSQVAKRAMVAGGSGALTVTLGSALATAITLSNNDVGNIPP